MSDFWGPADAEPGMGGMEDRNIDFGTGFDIITALGAPDATEDRVVNPALVKLGIQAGKAALGGAAAGVVGSALDEDEDRGLGGCILGHQAQEALKGR